MGSNPTPEDIMWEAYELGINKEVMEEMKRIRHYYPHDLNAAYTQAYANVTASKAAEKFEGTIWPDYNKKQNGEDAI